MEQDFEHLDREFQDAPWKLGIRFCPACQRCQPYLFRPEPGQVAGCMGYLSPADEFSRSLRRWPFDS